MCRVVISTVALLLGLQFPADTAVAQSDLPDKIHAWVIENYREYDELPKSKVLVACIEWNRATPPPAFVHQVFATYSDPNSDRPIFLEQLASDARQRCKKWRKAKKIDCKCQALDKDGKNVLKAPK
jgi:hypothetical protein